MRVHFETDDLTKVFAVIEFEARTALQGGERFSVKVSPSVLRDGFYVVSGYTERMNG